MTEKTYHALSGFEQVALQREVEELNALVEELVVAVEIASDYLPQHWDMTSSPLNKINAALLLVAAYNARRNKGK